MIPVRGETISQIAESGEGGRRMLVRYTCAKCGTTGHDEVHRIGEGNDDGLYACLSCWKEWAEDYKRRKKNDLGRDHEQG